MSVELKKPTKSESDLPKLFAVAGELYGRLYEALTFGDLSMSLATRSPGEPAYGISFRWQFKAKGEWYGSRFSVPFMDLRHGIRSVEALAEEISDRWKDDHRNVTGEQHGL